MIDNNGQLNCRPRTFALLRIMFLRLRSFALAAALVAALTPAAGAQSPADDETAGVAIVHIEGRGHGHGVGMSQWGAFAMAQQGSSAAAILATFYPGTQLGSASGEVTVGIDQRAVVQISFPGGGQIRASRDGSAAVPGFPVDLGPGEVATIHKVDGGYQVTGGVRGLSGSAAVQAPLQECQLLCPPTTTTPPSTTTTAPPDGGAPTTTAPGEQPPADDPSAEPPADGQEPDGPPTSPSPVWAVPAEGGTVTAVDRGRTYRGVLQIAGALSVTNHVDVESYLKGMIEVPGHWPAAAVQAQSIAARTYALRAMATGGSICDTDACQVYLGTARESPGLNAAVDATRATVVTYNGGLAASFYSASAGGVSATPQEGFGNDTTVPYLRPVEHPDGNPQPWTVDVALDELGRRFGYPGTVTDVRVDEVGPSGRALAVSFDGDAGVVTIDPQDFRRKLGLRSTLYTVVVSSAATAPEPPDPSDQASALVGPEETGIASGVPGPAIDDGIEFAVANLVDERQSRWPLVGAATGAVVVCGLMVTSRRRRMRMWVSRALRRSMGSVSRRAGTMSTWLLRRS